MTKPRVLKLSAADRHYFNDIRLNSSYIFVGNIKLERTRVGIYNQVYDYFMQRYKGKAPLFLMWLAETYGVGEVNPDIIAKWEDGLLLNTKPSVFSLILKQLYNSNGDLEFYALVDDMTLKFIASTADNETTMISKIVQYLKYNPTVKKICNSNGLESLLDGTLKSELRVEFEQSLKHDTIELIDSYAVLSNTKDRYALSYYDFAIGDDSRATPAWDNFIKQIADKDAASTLMAWIYSVFKGDNYGRQILWLYGAGNTGKSVIGNAIYKRLCKLNKDIVTSLEGYKDTDKFSTSSYVDKRFTLDADTRNLWLLTNTLVKNLTGNDHVSIREMNKSKSSKQVYSKIMATSNSRPFIDCNRPEQISRLIYIELDNDLCQKSNSYWHDNNLGDWNALIDLEIDDFIAKCKKHYDDRLLEDGKNLRTYDGMTQLLDGFEFYMLRDIRIWWRMCYVPLEAKDKAEVLTLDNLVKDFKRFIEPTLKLSYSHMKQAKTYILGLLRERGVPIKTLDYGEKQYITGFKPVKKYPLPTSKTVLEKSIKKAEIKENEQKKEST